MAENTSQNNGSLLSNPLFYIGSGVALLAATFFVYKKYGQPQVTETETTETETKSKTVPVKEDASTKKSESSSAPKTAKDKDAATTSKSNTGKDYTSLLNSKTVYANSPDEVSGFKLGEIVTVKSGANVTRMDKGLYEVGTTKLKVNTKLGDIWHLFPSSVIVRASSGFDYPFYKVAMSEIDKGILGNIFGADGFIGADGFGGLEHLPAEGRAAIRDAKINGVIHKLSNKYMGKFGIWGVADKSVKVGNSKWILAGIEIMSTNAALAKINLPHHVDGYELFFTQGDIPSAV